MSTYPPRFVAVKPKARGFPNLRCSGRAGGDPAACWRFELSSRFYRRIVALAKG